MMTSISLPRYCFRLALKQLIRMQYRPLLRNGTRYSSCLLYSTNGDKPKVLGVSSVTQQDGLEFQELPVLVRHLETNMLPLSYATEKEATADEHDEYVKTQLQSCKSVQDILTKLEIPSKGLTGLSAAFTLQRIWQLKEASVSINAESYIEAEFLDELYGMIDKNISSFSDEILITLVQGYCTSESFQSKGTECLSKEIQKRLGDFKFSVLELCILSNILCRSNTELRNLVNLIWVHMCHRTDINEKNLATVFLCVPKQNLSTSIKKNLRTVLMRKFTKTWWYFSGKELGCLSIALNVHNVNDWKIYDFISKWMFVNICTIEAVDLMHVVSVFLSQKVDSVVFLEALDKYVLAQGLKINLDLLAMIMEYYCGRRYLSEKVLDMVAKIFIKHGETFSTLQLYSILRQFGHFNYRSPYLDEVFKVAENVIDKKFDQFEPLHICQLLCSFTYIERLPVNFASKIMSPSFWLKCKESLNTADLAEVDSCMSALEYSLIVKGNLQLRYPTRHMAGFVHHLSRTNYNLVNEAEYLISRSINEGRWKWCQNLATAIKRKSHLSYGFILLINEDNKVLLREDFDRPFSNRMEDISDDSETEVSQEENSNTEDEYENKYKTKEKYKFLPTLYSEKIKKVVFLLYPEDHFCSNKHSLLGKYTMQKEELKYELPNCEIVEIAYDELQLHNIRKKLKGIIPVKNRYRRLSVIDDEYE